MCYGVCMDVGMVGKKAHAPRAGAEGQLRSAFLHWAGVLVRMSW